MDLKTYLKSLPEPERERLASACDTTVKYLWKLARNANNPDPKKRIRPSAEVATQVELFSNRSVRRWESIPERWHRIWPELVGRKGAPEPSTTEQGA